MTLVLPTLADLQDEATWLEWRARVPGEAAALTDLVSTDESRAEFLEGARLLRLDQRRRAGDGGMGPSPLQLVIADMLAARRKFNGILDPRRSTKTTSIQCVILGRCHYNDDTMVGWTMTKKDGGGKTGERFRKDIVTPLTRLYPDPKTRPFVINTGKGSEHIRWPNGSYFNVYAPGNEGFTSGAYDIAWVDEAQDATPEQAEDLMTSIPPTMDGRYKPQMIASGTAPDFRDGNLLWDILHLDGAGVVWHGIPDSTDPEELEAWEPSEEHPRGRVRELIELHHPGVGFTTPLSDVEDNFKAMKAKAFNAEYLGQIGAEGVSLALIPAKHRERAAISGPTPPPPGTFTLAISVHPDSMWASVGVAWMHEEHDDLADEAWKLAGALPDEPRPARRAIGLLHHQPGTRGFAAKVLLYARKYRVPIIYDQASQSAGVIVEELARATPRPALTPATTLDVRRAATKTVTGFEQGTLVYWREQTALDTALEIAVKRNIGTYGGYGFGRRKDQYQDDITPVEAASLALQFLEDAPRKVAPEEAMHF
jgi:hypothetical protein